MTSQHSRNGCEGSPARCAGWAAFVVFAADPAETDVQNEQEGSNFEEERTKQAASVRPADVGDAAEHAAAGGICSGSDAKDL